MNNEKQDEYDYKQTRRIRQKIGSLIRLMSPTCLRKEMSPHRLTFRFAKGDLVGAWKQLRSHEVSLKRCMKRNNRKSKNGR